MQRAKAGAWETVTAITRACAQQFARAPRLEPRKAFARFSELGHGGRLFDSLPLRFQRVTVRDAAARAGSFHLAYREHRAANPGAPTVVCVPGLGDSSETYRLLVEVLSPHVHVVLVDPPGFGHSQVVPRRSYFTSEVLRDGLREFLLARRLNRPSTVLLGNSLGGALAMGVVASLGRRNRMSRVVLLASAAYPQRLNFVIRVQRMPFHAFFANLLSKTFLARAILWDSFGRPERVSRECVEDLARNLARYFGLRAFMFLCRDLARLCRDARRGGENVLTWLVPAYARATARTRDRQRRPLDTLVIHGDRDRIVPPWVQERLERDVPNVQRVTVAGLGHLPQQEEPVLVARTMLAFLERTASRSE